jgi:tripeptide aminopeptidase
VRETFFDLVRTDSPSGEEDAVAAKLLFALARAGLEASRDPAGSVIARRAGWGSGAGLPPLLLSAHMDTVQPGYGIDPQERDGIIHSNGTTILAADDKAGITAILEALRVTHGTGVDCRPVEVAFTVEEETGLAGAKALDLESIAARDAIVLDSTGPVGTIITRAPAQNGFQITVTGKAAHAGVSPEKGVSAIVAAARALAAMKLGRIDEETTANVGTITGGVATNIVPERVELKGEARSRDEAKLAAQTQHMVETFERAAREMGATADVVVTRSYSAIDVAPDAPIVALVSKAMQRCGVEPKLGATGGGSDANVYSAAGLAAVNLGIGMSNPHSVDEQIPVSELLKAAEVVLAIITSV